MTKRVTLRGISTITTVVVLLTLLNPVSAIAQDANYWTNQFGNEARLLGGAVVGSSDNVAAVFYNPGRLALTEAPELVLAGNVIRYTDIKFVNALGNELDLSSVRLAGVPALFAGEIRLGGLKDHRLGYSFLTRHDFGLRIETRGDFTDLFPEPVDKFTASVNLDKSMNEYWAGLTWARPFNKKFGLGVSVFGLYRDQRSRLQTLAQAQVDSSAGVALQRNDFDYLYVGLLAKIGVGANFDSWRLGLAITTPNLKLYGTGSLGFDRTLVTQDLNNDGSDASLIITDFQEGLTAHYHSPVSVSAGLGYRWKSTTVDLTAEWFDAVGSYQVLETQPIPARDTVLTLPIMDQRKSVTNFALGVQQEFNPKLQGYASFRTDFSAATGSETSSVTLSTWDIYHLAAGLAFPIGTSEFTVGGVYAFGSEPREQGVALIPDEAEDGDELILPQDITAKFRRITFVLGFSIVF